MQEAIYFPSKHTYILEKRHKHILRFRLKLSLCYYYNICNNAEKRKTADSSCKNIKQGSFHSSVKKKSVCCHPTLHLDSKRAPDSHLTMVIMQQLKGHLFCNLTHTEDSKFGRLDSSRDQEESPPSVSHQFKQRQE